MDLTTEQMNTIMADELNGKPQKIHGKEADKFLSDIKKDIEKANKDGIMLTIPPEWPSMGDD